MAGITLKIAEKHLNAWLETELTVKTKQSYTIGSRNLTRADLSDIREQIVFWESKVAQLENQQKRGGRNRIIRIVPRDL